jgi:O-antigen ligase
MPRFQETRTTTHLSGDAPYVALLSKCMLFLAIPAAFYLTLTFWPESLERQIAVAGALLGLIPFLLVRNKLAMLFLSLLFFSQVCISLYTFNLIPPARFQIHYSDVMILLLLSVALECGVRTRLDGTGRFYLVFIAWLGIAAVFSAHPHHSYVFVAKQLIFLMLYVLALNITLSETFADRVAFCVLAVTVVQGGIAIAQAVSCGPVGLGILGEFTPERLDSYMVLGGFRTSGTISGTNAFAGYIAMLLVFLFPFVMVRRSLPFYAGFTIGGIALVLSLSRAGWLGFAIGCAAAVIMLLRNRMVRFTRLAFFGLMGGIVLAGIVAGYSGKIVNRFQAREAITSAEGRITQFTTAGRVIRNHFWIGIGPGVTEFYGRWNKNRQYVAKVLPDVDMSNQVHSSLLQVFIESGFLGILIYLVLVGTILAPVVRRPAASTEGDSVRLLRIGGSCSAAAVLVDIAFGTEFNSIQIFTAFWVLLGFARNRRTASSP